MVHADLDLRKPDGRSLFAPYAGSGPEPIGFFLVPQFSMMAFLSAIEPLRVANRLSGRKLFEWRVYSLDGEPVEGSNGMKMVAQGRIDSAADVPTLFVCAGFEPERFSPQAAGKALRQMARRGLVLGAIDTGVWLLARAGVLNDAVVTMHWEALPAFREEFPEIAVTEELFEVSRGRITCAGGTAAMDMMLAMIADRHGPKLAASVSEQFIHERMRKRHDQQRTGLPRHLGITDKRLLGIVDAMERQIEAPRSCAQLAARAGLSARQLERLFQVHLATTPSAFYLRLRLDRARQLLRQTDMAVLDVATACGFNAASSLTRAYKAHFGKAPNFDRHEPQ